MSVKYLGGKLAGVNTTFLTKFTAAVSAIGGTKVRVISGYRQPGKAFKNFYGQTVTETNGPHNQGIALDAEIYIPGKGWVPAGTALKNIAPQFGLRSGDQPNFYLGNPDPNHVDMVTTNPQSVGNDKSPPSGKLSYQQIQSVWIQAGGQRNLAPTMALIAYAESGGDPNAHNYNPSTGDDSYGLWQINYYGNLREPRTREFGPPSGMFNPANNAAAAVTLAKGGAGLNNWSTYKSGAYSTIGNVSRATNQGGGGSPFSGITSFFSDPFGIKSGIEGGLNTIGHDILYVAVILGGGSLIVLGLLMVGIDLGLSSRTPTPVKTVTKLTGQRRARKEGAATRAAGETRKAELHTERVKTEKARATELRSRSRARNKQVKLTKEEKAKIERSAYFRGAADAGKP